MHLIACRMALLIWEWQYVSDSWYKSNADALCCGEAEGLSIENVVLQHKAAVNGATVADIKSLLQALRAS